MNDGKEVLFHVDDLSKSPQDVLTAITKGLAEMGVDMGSFGGHCVTLLRVPTERAEFVETAAKRGGVKLTSIDVPGW